MDAQSTAARPNGLQTLLNVIAAPREAFETLRIAPMWGWAFLVAALLGIAGSILLLPAIHHATSIMWATDPRMTALTDSQRMRAQAIANVFINLTPALVVIGLLLGALIQTIIMVIFKAIGRGEATFMQLWSATMNIAVVSSLQSLALGIIVAVLGPDHFSSTAAVQHAMPSLALLAPHAGKLTGFLSAFTPFAIWAVGLIIVAMLTIARTTKAVAWVTGIISMLVPALLAAAFTPAQ